MENLNSTKPFVIGSQVLLGPGPIGTMLSHCTACVETLNPTPAGRETLQKLYREYLALGADFITTNTFAANRHALEQAGLGDAFREINLGAVEAAAALDVPVLASLGPADLRGAAEQGELEAIYAEEAELLAETGKISGFLLETFSAGREAAAALTAVNKTGLPFIFSLNANRFFPRHSHATALRLLENALEAGATAVGCNCGAPFQITALLQLFAENFEGAKFYVAPNAGTPELTRGVLHYNLPDAVLQIEAEKWLNFGVSVISGCCGMEPAQMQLLAERCRGREIKSYRRNVRTAPPAAVAAPEIPVNPLRTDPPRIALELRFPAGGDYRKIFAEVETLRRQHRMLFTIPDCPTGNPGCDPMAAAALLKQRFDNPVMLHMSCGNRNLCKVYADLFGARSLGVEAVLAISGDSPMLGPFGRLSSRVGDLANSADLLRLLERLGRGEMLNDQQLPEAMPFVRACAFAPGNNPAASRQWLERKAEAGAEWVFTQPIFSLPQLAELRQLVPKELKLFAGVLPLTGAKQARNLRNGLIPGVRIDDETIDALETSADPEATSLAMATSLAREILAGGDRLYLILPFSGRKFQIAGALLSALEA
ncbi:MAG: homocysteine S-methyltransferase family protein [Victivallaceae bacterium]